MGAITLEEKEQQIPIKKSMDKSLKFSLIFFVAVFAFIFASYATSDTIKVLPYLTDIMLLALSVYLFHQIILMKGTLHEVKKEIARSKKEIQYLLKDVQKLDDQLERIRLDSMQDEKADQWENRLDSISRNRAYRKKPRKNIRMGKNYNRSSRDYEEEHGGYKR